MFDRYGLRRVREQVSLIEQPWGAFRRLQFHHDYARRRELYWWRCHQSGLVYEKSDVIRSIRARLAARNATPVRRSPGDVHTFAFIPSYTWHGELLPDLRELGKLTVFDYRAHGYDWNEFLRGGNRGRMRRQEMNERFVKELRQTHAERPVDWIFVYASGIEISAEAVRRISVETGLPTVNMCLDDKQSWSGPWMGDHRGGQIDIAREFDLSWTSARLACEWYLAEGGRPIYMPEGFDQATYHPTGVSKEMPVSFVGGAYGYRRAVIRFLRRHGVEVHTFGQGWAGAVWATNVRDVFSRSVINLGMGGIGYSEMLTNVKGRDFEAPGTGGGAYLTSFNPDLAQHFVIGEEILCYRHRDELLELIRFYLAHPEEAGAIARRGRERCLREHRWLHRFMTIGEILGIFPEVRAASGLGHAP